MGGNLETKGWQWGEGWVADKDDTLLPTLQKLSSPSPRIRFKPMVEWRQTKSNSKIRIA